VGTDNLQGFGNDLANTLVGNSGDNILDGGSGNDTLKAGDGADTVHGGLGNDQLLGEDGGDTLYGEAGNDTLNGGAGDDFIYGLLGNDTMTGGTGKDAFVVLSGDIVLSKTPAGGVLQADIILDLNKGEGDYIDLSDIDADLTTDGNQAFHLVTSLTKHAGEMTLTYNSGTGQTLLVLDVDGDGKADYQLKITGDVHLDSPGWLL